jgi:hypothetical protein
MAEYERLLVTYPALGYELIALPKIGVVERADFILETLQRSSLSAAPRASTPATTGQSAEGLARECACD